MDRGGNEDMRKDLGIFPLSQERSGKQKEM
jgi:hypothetical protein